MNKAQLNALVVKALEDLKAKDVVCLDVTSVTDMTDTMYFVTGTSNRHVKSLAENVSMEVKKAGRQPLGIEGQDVGDWVLVDLGEILVHVMLPEIRDLYDLEKLWSIPERSDDA
ncbi:MAG: ribosome silencing factor [Pseudomonadales bacterium]|nr:ribosome silencing factor [Pseudomonadales bacterium]